MLYVAAMVLIAALSSCKSGNDNKITHIPFQESKDGWWGMIGLDGEVLFINQFKNEPTMAKNGFFLVRNQDGFWEYYTVDKKPEKKGNVYVSATLFNNGVALVVEPNKPVEIINTKFEVIKTLDQIEGRKITNVYPFEGGYAVVICGDVSAVIDEQGNVILSPAFDEITNNGDGTFCAVELKDKETKYDSDNNVQMHIYNAQGQKIGSYPYTYTMIEGDGGPTDCNFVDSLAIATNTGEKYKYNSGIINMKGEFVVKPSEETSFIDQLQYGMYVHYSSKEEAQGVKKITGEVVVKPSFDGIDILSADRLAFGTEKKVEENEEEEEYDLYETPKDYYMVDLEGNRLGNGIYESIYRFKIFDGKHTIAKVNKNKYTIIDYDGNEMPNLPTLYNISIETGDYCLQSDYVDLDGIVNELKITEYGMFGISMTTPPSEAVNVLDYWSKSPEHLTSTNELTAFKTIENVYANFKFVYSENLSYQSYTTQRIYDGFYWNTYYYHDEKIPGGYRWRDTRIKAMGVYFNNSTNLHGKLKNLKEAIVKKLKSIGNVGYNEGGATYVNLTSGYQAVVIMNSNNVYLVMGNIKPAEDLSLDLYSSEKEKVFNYDENTEIDWESFMY